MYLIYFQFFEKSTNYEYDNCILIGSVYDIDSNDTPDDNS